MPLTEILADPTLNASPNAFSNATWRSGEKMMLDALACAVGARDEDGIDAVTRRLRAWGGAPEAACLVMGGWLPAPSAAFANGVLVHALDFDDVHLPTS